MINESHTLVIDPIYDEGFKLIFGRENISEPLLINLLNSIFAGDPTFGNITSVTFVNTERPNEYVKGKGIRYDIKCVTADHHHFIVEMQKGDQKHFIERCGYYVSRATAEQGYRGRDEKQKEWDFSLLPVVGVFFCNFYVEGLQPKPLTTARLRDDETGEPIGNFQRFAFIQLPSFKKEKEDCSSEFDQWIYNIKNMGNMQRVSFTTDNDIFEYLKSVSDVATLPPAERDIYEACLMRARDYNAVLKTAKERALEEGRAEGRAEGLFEAAERLKANGVDEATIKAWLGI